ncbi:KdpD-like non-kinase potassium sensor [Bacillus sonorensis]|uniref:KdpD-like non-kinase potassium sensor n=1 Tax=Bacillus sonorensis TaxID=119858 RepID=UPI0004961267|nr:KdpD-like non-kinase potassium sensor [Bacillus sonorensis]MCF7617568.1 KdpD-like non-kinase potassium sensor [Bacillus sonorensis]MCY8404694.1 KdpD-like non-kinase potassium sensor [Bacillus sonorensis]MCZ0067236.1 KdpD-like non-kinase potassium sensor [Bacillus sonorensis]MCZ0095766.1 KdpD-like non-kinase potassium sensor [Bacillus sonorensis]MEC1426984.1 KdpD-like non-kinase potassium sensor [Bacillus sonorensis]
MRKNSRAYRRKTPEELLAEIEQLKRGSWTIYIGSAPGVGKTYRMLQEAHDVKREGIDVVIGLVETHNRKETAALIRGLEVIPKRKIEYKGKTLEEMDAAAIIERKPDLVIIDELAHTNIPGSKNEKRYMDVEDILREGVNVLSAVNIQHIESVHDIVQQVTGVKVRERIPDRILDLANEVILIDVTPETLQKRLREGKIYEQHNIQQALTHFFTKNNLAALRELALREVADDVDDRIERLNRQNGYSRPRGTNEKILVCVQHGKNAEKLIRRGWRIANRLKAELFVLHVSRKAKDQMTANERHKIQQWERLCGQFGAGFIFLPSNDRRISEAITGVAKQNNITQIVLGQSARSRWEEIWKGSIVNSMMRHTDGIDIHIVSDDKTSN